MKEIASARAFVGNWIQDVILMCNLKPIESWKKWQDEFGNKLTITTKKVFIITKNKNQTDNYTSDLFVKSTRELVEQNSYWKMDYINSTTIVTWFIGNDGRLRIFYGEKSFAPLLSGIDILRQIAVSYRNESQEVINSEKIFLYPEFVPIKIVLSNLNED